MKKLLLVATVVAGVIFVYQQREEKNELFMENVEALSRIEGGNYTICYSESKVLLGYSYYDCGSCTKIYDEKGKGKYSKCFK